MAKTQKMVTLVFDRTLTPYKAGEIASFTEEDARKLLTPNRQKNDFGEIYPSVKAHEFNPESSQDLNLLLQSGTLNKQAHNKLCDKLGRPDLKHADADTPALNADWADELGIFAEEPKQGSKTTGQKEAKTTRSRK